MPFGNVMWGNEAMLTRWPWCLPTGLVLPQLPADIADLGDAFPTLVTKDAMTLPRPGGGRTSDRFIALAEVSAVDLSLGRLVEGHADAVAILAEAGRVPRPDAVMGVWAARRPGRPPGPPTAAGGNLTATWHRDGWRLQGGKPWASGARMLTHALVTATTRDGDCLFEIPVDDDVTVVAGTWPAVGMAMSESFDVEIDVLVDDGCLIGPTGWYVDRPGFWFGSVGVAACWLGGAVGLVRTLRADLATRDPDPHQLAHLGAAAARCASLARDIAWAAGRIDANPEDSEREMRELALEVRHLVEEGCLEVLTHVGRAGGSAPLCHDAGQARRLADLPVYIRQHHAERDTEALGRFLLAGRAEK